MGEKFGYQGVLRERKNRPKRQIPRFKPKSLAFRIVIYMKRLGYLEKVGLNRREKCQWSVKTGGFSRKISIKEG